ncbi:hypothetical protein NA56DRAFT_747751 [Hyaloscypha hepaticicola]|uniref:Uncharacterized protein n=1 Tax=Hyaloscypha hepaticicola TaxID=2082293 RepID=A0A2J6Q8A1_9HELO|nr:hypothetical protein NA56DRAFT_747751 [Hyaloscypha hepaticicola]
MHFKQTLDGRYFSERKLIGLLQELFGENFECQIDEGFYVLLVPRLLTDEEQIKLQRTEFHQHYPVEQY